MQSKTSKTVKKSLTSWDSHSVYNQQHSRISNSAGLINSHSETAKPFTTDKANGQDLSTVLTWK